MTNEELILEYQRTKDEQYISELFEQNKKLIHKLSGVFNCDEDLIYVGFMKAVNTYNEDKGKFTTLMYNICLNDVRVMLRKKQPQIRSLEDKSECGIIYNEVLDEDFDIEDYLFKKEIVKKILDTLDERSRTIVTRLYLDDVDSVVLQKEMGLSRSYFSKLRRKALKLLKIAYNREMKQ